MCSLLYKQLVVKMLKGSYLRQNIGEGMNLLKAGRMVWTWKSARKMKTSAFPTRNINRPQNLGQPNSSRFVVTLRHGCIGIKTILKYFGIDQFLETRQSGDRFPCPSIRNELHSLLQAIQTNYHLESKRTRRYIKQFIGCLRSANELMQTDFHRTEREFPNRMLNNIEILFNK